MTLHIFNPSHDEALAANDPYYYPSLAARNCAEEGALYPLLWAERGDGIWIEAASPGKACPIPELTEEEAARRGIEILHGKRLPADLWPRITRIEPWGWDKVICQRLRRAGAPEHLLPSPERLDRLRYLSSRETTSRLLPHLRRALLAAGIDTVGGSVIVRSPDEAQQYLHESRPDGWVAKSLWSCSGRGVFRLGCRASDNEMRRMTRLIATQGGLELQPFHRRLYDFALEWFYPTPGYLGLSLFTTHTTGGYAHNEPLTQAESTARLERLMPDFHTMLPTLVQLVGQELHTCLGQDYEGPLGIDMMIADTPDGARLCPCIELNLRRTMGHVALARVTRDFSVSAIPSSPAIP